MVTSSVFNFINTDRYSGAAQKGVTFTTSCYVYQVCSSLPDDLNNYRPRLVVRDTFCSPTIIVDCTLDNDRAELQGDRGIVNFIISAEDTALLPAGMFVYEITITSLDDLVFRLAYGKFEVMC